MSEETADILAGGREYIEKNGWWKSALIGPNGKQACVVGGLIRSLGLAEDELRVLLADCETDPRVVAACQVLEPLLPRTPRGGVEGAVNRVEWWNDHLATKQQVLDLMAKAEKIERAGFDPDAP